MRVSVIVPVYNKVSYLKRSIDSILRQKYQEFELIIVDDGSTDGSGELLKQFDDPRITIISQGNAGPGAARNCGIKNSNGELVAFLDADDEWLPDYLSESIALLDTASKDTVAVASGYFEYPQGKSTESMWYRRGIREKEVTLDPRISPMLVVHLLAFMSSWSVVVRRNTLLRFGGFFSDNHCRYAEDSFLWLKILLNETVRFNLNPLVNFHREASQLSKATNGPHPIEPFLLYPEKIRNECPAHLQDLLEKVLTIRAFKTACMLGYWGYWRKARRLVKAFAHTKSIGTPYWLPALVCSTPLGPLIGKIFRACSCSQSPQTKDLTNRSTGKGSSYLEPVVDEQ